MLRTWAVSRVLLFFGALLGLARCAIEPFSLSDVQLGEQTLQSLHHKLNLDYLLNVLQPDRLLWTFRRNAGLPTVGRPYEGTWEDENCEVRGQFMGHYLTALTQLWLVTGDAAVRARVHQLVGELAAVQAALGGGYLSAFPAEHFDRLQALRPVWAPYYVIHKLLAGLLDAGEHAGSSQAMAVAQDLAAYFLRRIDLTLKVNGSSHWQRMLRVEFGGMNDVMFRMFSLTADPDHLRMARLFTKKEFFAPLLAGGDPLGGLHANTHLAQVVGFASGYDVLADASSRAAVEQFFTALTLNHSYATGGSNDHEMWGPANSLADAIFTQHDALETQETCTQYNVLKLARALFRWTGAVQFADYYERALLNGILGAARLPPSDIPIWGGKQQAGGGHSHSHSHSHHFLAHPQAPGLDAFWMADSSEAQLHGAHGGAVGHLATRLAMQPGFKGEGAGGSQSVTQGDPALLSSHAHPDPFSTSTAPFPTSSSSSSSSSSSAAASATRQLTSAPTPSTHALTSGHHTHTSSPGSSSSSSSSSSMRAAASSVAAELGSAELRGPAAGVPGGLGPQGGEHAGGCVVATHRRARPASVWGQQQPPLGFRGPPEGSAATNQPGPGVFLYLTPLGTGQSKGDNSHHWGFPENSFWCCYGTAVESFSKLADSIYFKQEPLNTTLRAAAGTDTDINTASRHHSSSGNSSSRGSSSSSSEVRLTNASLPVLYLNQFVSSRVAWTSQGLALSQEAAMFAPGPSAAADIHLTEAPAAGLHATLALRLPSWLNASARVTVQVNSQDWSDCPGAPQPASYCNITRRWQRGDVLRLSLPMSWVLQPLAESRPQFNGLQAVMMGPYLMAGLTHAGRHLALPLGGGGLPAHVSHPDEGSSLVSLQAGWDAVLFIRHDLNLLHVSEVEDNGDAMDATFKLVSGCQYSGPHTARPTQQGQQAQQQAAARQADRIGAPAAEVEEHTGGGGQAEAAAEAWEGQADASRVPDISTDWGGAAQDRQPKMVTLEAMNYPGYFVSFDPELTLGLDQPDGSLDFCAASAFLLRPGLTGDPASTSLEAASKPGWFLSAYSPPGLQQRACLDLWPTARCLAAVRKGRCVSTPEVAERHCRQSCGKCTASATARHLAAMRLQRLMPDDPNFAAASTFVMTNPLTPRYPEGSRIVTGKNRAYLLMPLGHIVDERYTAYFDLTISQ